MRTSTLVLLAMSCGGQIEEGLQIIGAKHEHDDVDGLV